MNFAKIKNGQVLQYPTSPRADHPNISFSEAWAGGVVEGDTYVVVHDTTIPQPKMGWFTKDTGPALVDDRWERTWSSEILPKDDLKRVVTEKRYEIEVGGTKVNNIIYATDRESQTKYIAVAIELQQANTQTWSILWKTLDGTFVQLNAIEMSTVIDSVRNHIQNCYNKEAEYHSTISTSSKSVLESTDFNLGWPAND